MIKKISESKLDGQEQKKEIDLSQMFTLLTDDTLHWKARWVYTTETGFVQPISSSKQMSMTLQRKGIEKQQKGDMFFRG